MVQDTKFHGTNGLDDFNYTVNATSTPTAHFHTPTLENKIEAGVRSELERFVCRGRVDQQDGVVEERNDVCIANNRFFMQTISFSV